MSCDAQKRAQRWSARQDVELRNKNISAPFVMHGDATLRERLLACLCAGDEGSSVVNARKPELNIMVLGASIALGSMNCGVDTPCTGNRLQPNLTWVTQTASILRKTLVGCHVNVELSAGGGWTSTSHATGLHQVLKASGPRWDAFVLDMSVSDAVVSHWGADLEMVQYALSAAESIVRRLVVHRIPVILLDTIKSVTPLRCDANANFISVYKAIATHWRLPYVNLQEAVCAHNVGNLGLYQIWRSGCSRLNAPWTIKKPFCPPLA